MDFRHVRLIFRDTTQIIGDAIQEENREVSSDWPLPVRITDLLGNDPSMLYGNLYKNITGQTTNIIKSGAGVLHAITFNKPIATSVVTIYDSDVVDATMIIGTITIPASPMQTYFLYDVVFTRGLTVVQGTASSDLTVSYQ